MKKVTDPLTVRMPIGMRDKLKRVAAENRRSMNAEIVAQIESALSKPARDSEIAALVEKYVAAEVSRRLAALAPMASDAAKATGEPVEMREAS